MINFKPYHKTCPKYRQVNGWPVLRANIPTPAKYQPLRPLKSPDSDPVRFDLLFGEQVGCGHELLRTVAHDLDVTILPRFRPGVAK